MRIQITQIVILSGLLALTACTGKTFSTAPNIIYILADDMGYGDVSVLNKESGIPTPNIDRIAGEGMIFTDAHSPSSVCTPTRYGILTGRYAWRTGKKSGVLQGHSPPLIDPDRETVASFLKGQGYQTACVGKWHLGMDWDSSDGERVIGSNGKNADVSCPVTAGPTDLGFDYFFGISASLNMPPHAYMEDNSLLGEVVYLDGKEQLRNAGIQGKDGWWDPEYRQEDVLPEFTDRAIRWMDNHLSEHPEDPFFLYMPLNAPHAPIVPNKEFAGQSRLGKYGDFCMEVDWSVGLLLDWLDQKGLSENTLVIFTADNGCSPQAGFEKLQAQGHYPSYIFRGLKGSLWEGGHRVPFLARWPAFIDKGTVSDLPICLTDLMATLADLAGKPLEPGVGEDSFSFLEAFSGKTPAWAEERGIVHHSDAGHFSIRRGKWKLVLHEEGGTRRHNPKDKPLINPAEIQLFDMEADPSETTNIQHLNPEVVLALTELLTGYISEGRSNPGPSVSNDPATRWPQIEFLEEL